MKLSKSAVLTKTVSPIRVSAKVGSVVEIDGLPASARKLRACDWWDEADFAWDAPYGGPIKETAANIYVTGRTIQYRGGDPMVKVQIEWPQDGEPSVFAAGWLYFNTADQEDA